jgi:hypothetical protein
VVVVTDGDDGSGWAVPAFKAADALQRLKRDLRELGLTERGGVWERKGVAVAKAVVDGAVIAAARVKKPSRNSPEWMPKSLATSANARDFVADLKQQLAQWSDSDD